MVLLSILNVPVSRVVMSGEYWLKMSILLTQHIGVGDSFIINTFQNGMTLVIQSTLTI